MTDESYMTMQRSLKLGQVGHKKELKEEKLFSSQKRWS